MNRSPEKKHNARVAGVFFLVVGIAVGALLFVDASDGAIRVGGGRGSRARIVSLDSDRSDFLLSAGWIGFLATGLTLGGIGLIAWGWKKDKR